MSAPPRLDPPRSHLRDRAPAHAQAPRRRRRPPAGRYPRLRVTAVAVAVLVLLGGVVLQHVRSTQAEEAERGARAQLASDVATVRTGVADPARAGQNTASALVRYQLRVVAGEAQDEALGERLVGELRSAAAELDVAAQAPVPARPSDLSDATLDPVFGRLDHLDAQAADLADTFRTAADDAEAWLAAVRGLDAAALAYADSSEELPSDDDPDVVADAWRSEHDRLSGYADGVEDAGGEEATAPLADAHGLLVEGMRGLADDALAHLEDGDLDAYNALLTDRLGGDDPFGFSAALEAARAEVADTVIAGPLEDARARALGLLTEVEELRRATPPQFAGQR